MKILKVAFNTEIIDKHEGGDARLYREEWRNAYVTIEELIEGQTVHGWAVCAHLSGPRCTANFLAADLAFVDIDNAPSIRSVLDHPLVAHHGAYAYTTVRHTAEKSRLRVGFVLPRTITNAGEFAALSRALMLRLSGDPSATDAARISFGSRGAAVFRLDGEMSDALLDELIAQGTATTAGREGMSRGDGSARSSIRLEDEQCVRLASGVVQFVHDTPPHTRVYCPYHQDDNPSAFIIQSQKGIRGVHCSTCSQTFWPAGAPEFDFDSFDRMAKEARARFDSHKDPGLEGFSPLFNTPDNHEGLTRAR